MMVIGVCVVFVILFNFELIVFLADAARTIPVDIRSQLSLPLGAEKIE